MKLSVCKSTRFVLGLVLLTGGLVIASGGARPALAAGATISVTDSYSKVAVIGQGFTPSGSVWVGVYDYTWNQWNTTTTTTATPFYCTFRPPSCHPGGAFSLSLTLSNYPTVCYHYLAAVAYDYSTGTWTSWVVVPAQCPSISVYTERSQFWVTVTGYGFSPNGVVSFAVWGLAGHVTNYGYGVGHTIADANGNFTYGFYSWCVPYQFNAATVVATDSTGSSASGQTSGFTC
jgi:hypothetical protein